MRAFIRFPIASRFVNLTKESMVPSNLQDIGTIGDVVILLKMVLHIRRS